MSGKTRLDVFLVEKGLAKSREKAKQLIEGGFVRYNGRQANRPSAAVDGTGLVELTGDSCRYVSRGGLKLEGAIRALRIRVENKVCLDIGSSTGGFTDCLLQHKAARVYAVDTGTDQLDSGLRSDKRVVSLENTDIRRLDRESVEPAGFICVDVAFISLKLIIPHLKRFLSENGKILLLVKPQFEAGRGKVGKNGIVKSKAVHLRVLSEIADFALKEGFFVKNIVPSPIKGQDGNVEFFLYMVYNNKNERCFVDCHGAVEAAHSKG